MPPLSLTILKYALMPSTRPAYDPPVGLLVFVTIVATSISVLLTPGAETGTFFLRSAALAVDVGPPEGSVAPEVSLLDPEFEQAAAIRTIAIATKTLRVRMIPPGMLLGFERCPAPCGNGIPAIGK